MKNRKVKRYAGDDDSLVEDDAINEVVKSRQKPDVEDMKRGIAAGTSEDRQTARDIQSFKAAEVRMPSKKAKPKPRYSGVVKANELGSQDFSSKASPAPKSSGDSGISKGAMAAGLGLAAAAGAGALGARRTMKEGSRQDRVEPSMGLRKSPIRNISTEEAAWEGEGGRAYKKGGKANKMAGGGSASSRADGIAQRGKTRGKVC